MASPRIKRKFLGLLFCCLFELCTNVSVHEHGSSKRTFKRDISSQGICSPPIKSSISEEVMCSQNDQVIDCDRPEDNTTAKVRCREFHISKGNSPIYRCQNGNWDHKFVPCVPACGMKNGDISSWVTEDTGLLEHEYPWLVAIYNKTKSLICSGTIISTYHVLSAAHCFTDETGKIQSKNDFAIVAGKNYSDWNIREKSVQIRNVELLFLHENYAGDDKNYQSDIALVKLNVELTLSLQVQPVCVDWNNIFEDFDFVDGTEGIVAGWGSETSVSNALRTATVPYRSRNTCLKHLPVDFGIEYFTSDKICAGYRTNNTVCQGDSGGGLYFQSDNKHFFIRGIVSIAIKYEDACNPKYYSLYTRISTYLPWIKAKVGK